MIKTLLNQIILAITIDWGAITDPIKKMFIGGENYTGLDGLPHITHGIIGNDPMLLGVFIFLVLFLLTLMFGLGILIGVVVIIPASFAVFQYVPNLQIVIAIICGLVFGLTLHKLVRR